MKKIELVLTKAEFDTLKDVLDKIIDDRKCAAHRSEPPKWIRQDGYLVNVKTGRRMDPITKQFF